MPGVFCYKGCAMDAKTAMRWQLDFARNATKTLLKDLSDADLRERYFPTANHLAWQLGHLISSEHQLVNGVRPGSMPALPPGFKETHGDKHAKDDEGAWATIEEYLRLYDEQRQGTLKVLEEIDPAEFDHPAPEALRNFIPTVGAVFQLAALHEMMHSGQITAVRRKLGKPHAF